MNLLFSGDWHFRLTPPENRIDDFEQTQKNKLNEVLDIGIKENVSTMFQPGDFWDIASPPLDYVVKVLSILARKEISEDELKTAEIPKPIIDVVGVVGNHEEFGNNINSIPKTMAGFIGRLGFMKYVTKSNPYFITTEDGLRIAVTGSNYNLDIDTPEKLSEYIVEEKLGDYHIHIVHGMLSDKSLGNKIAHTTIDMIKHTKADITLCGHDHMGFKTTVIDGKYFLNPGAIPRIKNDLNELKRKPKVYLVSITKEKGIEIKTKYLKSALPGESVLSRTAIEAKKDKEKQLQEYKNTAKIAESEKGSNINELILKVGNTKKEIPKNVITDILDKISEKIQKIGSNDSVKTDVYVKKLVLENFRSYEYQEFEFTNGFNMFVGESGHGKSNILRAFDFIYNNRGKSRRMIRTGTDFAKATVYLSNDYIISRYVEKKETGKNGYEIYDPNKKELEYFNTKYLPEVQKILGYSTLKIDVDYEISLNFMRQGHSWFLISDEYSGPKKAKIIGAIYGTQYSDAVFRDFEKSEGKLVDSYKTIQKNMDSINEELEKYSGLDDIQIRISKLKEISNKLKVLKERKKEVSELFARKEDVSKELEKANKTISESQNIELANKILTELKSDLVLRNKLEELYFKKCHIDKELEKQKEILDNATNINEAKQLLNRLKEMNRLRELLEKKKSLTNNLEEQVQIINKYKNIKAAQSMLSDIENMNEISNLIIKKKEIHVKLSQQQEILKLSDNVNKAKTYFNESNQYRERIKMGQEVLSKIKELSTKQIESEKLLKEQKLLLVKYKNIPNAKKMLEELRTMLISKSEIIKHYNKQNEILKDKKASCTHKAKLNTELNSHISKYKSILLEKETCPICTSKIDKITVEKIIAKKIAK